MIYVESSDYYFQSKDRNYGLDKFFNREEFVFIYYILMGYGVSGRKYQNVLMKFFKENNLNFKKDLNSRFEGGNIVGDDESEVFFFDVIYDCKKMKTKIRD